MNSLGPKFRCAPVFNKHMLGHGGKKKRIAYLSALHSGISLT